MAEKKKNLLKTIRNPDGSQSYSRGKTAKEKYDNSYKVKERERTRSRKASAKGGRSHKEVRDDHTIRKALRANVNDNFTRVLKSIRKKRK